MVKIQDHRVKITPIFYPFNQHEKTKKFYHSDEFKFAKLIKLLFDFAEQWPHDDGISVIILRQWFMFSRKRGQLWPSPIGQGYANQSKFPKLESLHGSSSQYSLVFRATSFIVVSNSTNTYCALKLLNNRKRFCLCHIWEVPNPDTLIRFKEARIWTGFFFRLTTFFFAFH